MSRKGSGWNVATDRLTGGLAGRVGPPANRLGFPRAILRLAYNVVRMGGVCCQELGRAAVRIATPTNRTTAATKMSNERA
jgi:hypothetical protein